MFSEERPTYIKELGLIVSRVHTIAAFARATKQLSAVHSNWRQAERSVCIPRPYSRSVRDPRVLYQSETQLQKDPHNGLLGGMRRVFELALRVIGRSRAWCAGEVS